MISVLKVDLRLNQGSKFEQPLVVRDNGVTVDLTGYAARMQIREYKDSEDLLLELTTDNNRIAITPTLGLVTLVVPGAVTAALDFGDAFYDLEIVEPEPGAEPIRIMEGRVSLSREVTR